ncbi:MAG: VWA domain-containing protein [Planctomycetaceae bacterium]
MSFPGFASLWAAWLFLIAAPLIVFYFLKLKRPRYEIPSLALWRAVINDQRVNSPFQRFKRNVLLLLQLLLLCLLVLAAMQPFIVGGPARGDYVPVLIDCSASMAATEKPGGPTRLDVAKERIGELIDALLPNQRMSLIAFSSTARRLTDFTDNKRILHDALDKIEVVDVPSRIEDALQMTEALVRTTTMGIDSVLMFTDGNLPEQVDFELSFQINYQQLPPAGKNIGITALNARRSSGGFWDIFVRVEASAAGQSAADVELVQNDTAAGTQHVVLDAKEAERLVFRVESEQEAQIELRLRPSDDDSLASDNVAFLTLPRVRLLTVFVPPDLASYRHALRAIPSVELLPQEGADAKPTLPTYDLLITDRKEDLEIEAAAALYVGIVPNDLTSLVKVNEGSADVVDWQRGSTLLQHVQLAEIQSTDEPHSTEGTADGDYEQLGYEILAFGRRGPLILSKRVGARVGFYLLFHSDRSTLPYRVAFPIMVSNLVEVALQQSSLSEVRGESTGVLPPLPLDRSRAYTVRGPEGFELGVASDENALVSGIPAERVGTYRFYDGGDVRKQVGVGLLDARESGLTATDEIRFPEDLAVSAAVEDVRTDKPLWPTFAILGFCVLLVEWWYFHRRPGGVPTQ